MPRMLNELQLRLLRDFDGTREVLTAADELEQVVRKALSDHVRAWIDAALEGDWQADLQDRSVMGRLAFWRSSWRREIQGATEIMMCGYLGVDLDVGEEGGSWTCHVLGAAPVTFRGGIAFDGLGRYLGGPDRALRLTQPMREQLSRGGFLVTTGPAGFRAWRSLRIDRTTLAAGFEAGDLDAAFGPVTAFLEQFKECLPALDHVWRKATAAGTRSGPS